jgi:hypothetical protein
MGAREMTDFKSIAENYPVAWEKFEEHVSNNSDYCWDNLYQVFVNFETQEHINNYELNRRAQKFFDERGIIITSNWFFHFSESFKGAFENKIWVKPEDQEPIFTTNNYDNREEPLNEAIEKAFEILEERLQGKK